MIPDPTPVAVPPNGPRAPPTWDVRVTTDSRAAATTAVMSCCSTVVVPPVVVTAAFGVGAAPAAEPVVPGWTRLTIVRVEPEARTAERSAAATTVPTVRRRPSEPDRAACPGVSRASKRGSPVDASGSRQVQPDGSPTRSRAAFAQSDEAPPAAPASAGCQLGPA